MTLKQVNLSQDHLNRVSKSNPIEAIKEIIYNSLDASSTKIEIYIDRNNELKNIERITIKDNGIGISTNDLDKTFLNYGESKKNFGDTNNLGKLIHGKNGEGRFKSYALGGQIEWISINQNSDKIRITGKTENKNAFDIDTNYNGDDLSLINKTGTIFTAENIYNNPLEIPEDEKLIKILEATFASSIDKKVSIYLNNYLLDPTSNIKYTNEDNLPHPYEQFKIKSILWNNSTAENNKLFWCNKGLQVLREDKLHKNKCTNNSLYIGSDEIEKSIKNNSILDMEETISQIKSLAIDKHNCFISTKDKNSIHNFIDNLKKDGIYPYENNEQKTNIEKNNKELFDILLVTIKRKYPTLLKGRAKQEKKLLLSSLKENLERSPKDIFKILKNVFDLSDKEIKDFSEILDRTSLTNMIETSKLICDRLDFLNALSDLTYGEKSKDLKERSELHRIIEKETWIFGDSYQLTTSDKSFYSIIKELRKKHLNDKNTNNENISSLIPDLFFINKLYIPSINRECKCLLVELKRPSVKIGTKEIQQIKNYALEITKDDRLNNNKWDLFILSSYINEEAIGFEYDKSTYSLKACPEGINIYIKTWQNIIDDNLWKYNKIKEELNINSNDEYSNKYLQEKYSEILNDTKDKKSA